jgi:hypothetical protein
LSSSIVNIIFFAENHSMFLKVAANAADELFIATPCCVHAMDNIWYDKLHPEPTQLRHKFTMFIGFITFGLLAPVFASYRQTKWVRNNLF